MFTWNFGPCSNDSWSISLILLCVIGLLPLAEPPAGQGRRRPPIIGQVKDETVAVLLGITLTATSPALPIRQAVTVTDDQGSDRRSSRVSSWVLGRFS
jgi:hypothetical protein